MGRSRSRSRSHSRGRRGRSRSRSETPEEDGYRVHVADLGIDCDKKEIERTFEKFGPLFEVWLARSPPCFAFLVYRHKEDAEDAVREMNGRVVGGQRVKVSPALPRTRGTGRRRFDSNMRCYQCGASGHFSRECTRANTFRRNRFTRSGSRSPPRRSRYSSRYSKSKSRSPRRNSFRRDSNRSRSPSRDRGNDRGGYDRGGHDRGNDREVSRSRSKSRS